MMADETATTEYTETWKGIAHRLRRSERWCRYMAQASQNPLPVFKVGGIVRLNHSDLESWLEAERCRAAIPERLSA